MGGTSWKPWAHDNNCVRHLGCWRRPGCVGISEWMLNKRLLIPAPLCPRVPGCLDVTQMAVSLTACAEQSLGVTHSHICQGRSYTIAAVLVCKLMAALGHPLIHMFQDWLAPSGGHDARHRSMLRTAVQSYHGAGTMCM